MPFGLSEERYKKIRSVFSRFPSVEEVLVFGSRAMDTYKPASDIDLALLGEKITHDDIVKIRMALDELPYGYTYDIIDYKKTHHAEFKKHIDKYGVLFFKKNHAPNEWKQYKLGDIVDDIAMGPFGSNLKVDNFISKGVPVIRGTNLHEGGFNKTNFAFVSEEKANSLKRCLAYPDDLVFTHRGTLGQVGIIPKIGFEKYLVSQSQMRLSINKEYLNPKYLYYFFKSSIGQNQLLKNASQVGVPAIANPTKSLKEVEISIPNLKSQQEIASVLSSLDNKIELNIQMKQTSEKIAQTLFKEWFLEFSPNGKKLKTNNKTSLPEGWRSGKLEEIALNYDNKRVPLAGRERDERKGQYPYYGAASILDYVDDFIFDGTYLLMGEDGTVITSTGFPVLQYVWGKFWVNNHAHVLKGKAPFTTEYLFLLLSKTNISNIVTGAVQQKINQGNLNKINCVIPPPNILKQFQNIIEPFFEKRKQLSEEINNLITVRDSLLPKLMTGKIAVK
jgi:type I restriction enzyme S subunit